MKKKLYSVFLFLIFLGNAAFAQSYFRVLDGIPHLPVLDQASITEAKTGMLIFSSIQVKPLIYNGSSWESLCTNTMGTVSPEDYFMVKAGISYLPVLTKDPANSSTPGTIYFSFIQKSAMIYNGLAWVKIQDLSKSVFSPNSGFAAGAEAQTFKLPVLAADPLKSSVTAGAFYLNSTSSALRYYDGTNWQDLKCIAEVLTLAVADIKGTTVLGQGEVISNGGIDITTRGFCWSTNPNPDISLSTKTVSTVTGSGLGIFTDQLSNLLQNTTYHVRAYATNSMGTVYGEDKVFTTLYDLPILITLPINTITSIDALSGGDISDDGGSPVSARGIRWSIKGDPLDDKDAILTNDGSGVGIFPSSMVGLLGNTTYYVRAYAVNVMGIAYGNLLSFTTPPPVPPALSSATVTVTDITDKSAIGEVNILNNGGAIVSDRGFAWSTDHITWTHGTSSTINPSDIGLYIANLTNLFPGTTYFAKGYATNSAGTAYTSETSFVTNSLALITTTKPSGLTGVSANGGGQISHNGGVQVTARGIVWNTSTLPTIDLPTKTQAPFAGDGNGSFGGLMKDLIPATTYYVRAYAVNEVGVAYGNEEVFRTPDYPTVSTLAAGSFYNNTAKGGGEVLNDGEAPVLVRGVVWSTEENPSLINSTSSSNGAGLGVFNSVMGGLESNTVYHVRAYATNVVGTAYGADKTFSLIPGIPEVSTQPVIAITNMTATGGGIITSNGDADITAKGVYWSKTGDPGDDLEAGMTKDGTGSGTYQSFLGNLLGNTTYYVRAYAENRFGKAYGDLITFVTPAPQLPTLIYQTLTITDIKDTQAHGQVWIQNNGGGKILSRGIAYSNDKLTYLQTESTTANGTDIGGFEVQLEGLIPGTVYYAKGYATNSAGTVYTREMSFITPLYISLSTLPVTQITSFTATTGGHILNPGSSGVVYRGIAYGTAPNPTTWGTVVSNGETSAQFASYLTGLTGSTRYYVRAYAGNGIATVYGNEESFMTAPAILPAINTLKIENIGGVTAFATAEIINDGGSPVSSRGICWNTTGDPEITEGSQASGQGKGLFNTAMSGLSPLTKYFVRAYAVNEVGVAYGNELSFTTATIATLTTLPATLIKANTANSGGIITADGGTPVIQSGVCWSTAGLPTVDDAHTSGGSGIGTFVQGLTELIGSTTYYIRAYAINSAGIAYGDVQQFITAPPVLATISTTTVTSGPKGITAISGGTIYSNGGAVVSDRGLVWSTQKGFDPEGAATNRLNVFGANNYSMTMTGLLPGTVYYVRAFATNSVGIAYAANEEEFRTFGFPELTTDEIATNTITSMSASAGGTITSNGGTVVTGSGVVWSTQSMPTINDNQVGNITSMGSFVSPITNLLGSTIYYVRAYAINSVGLAYGAEKTFSTLPAILATLTTNPATATSTTTATAGGTVLTNGGALVTTRGVVWSTDEHFNPDTVTLDKTAETGYITGSFSTALTGLKQHTVYYVRAYVINSVGTTYGNMVNFLTPQLPVLTTAFSKATGSTTAISGGDITNEGGSRVYNRGVVWSPVEFFNADTITVNRTSNGNGDGTFESNLKNLKANATYYVQAYASNVAGTTYGNKLNFKTDPPVLATLSTREASGITGSGANTGGYISDDGGAEALTRGMVWSTQSGFRPDTVINQKTIQTGAGKGTFYSTLNGLKAGTTYYIRAYVNNSVGTAYGNELSFTTLIVPTLTTAPVTVSSAGITAIGGGTIISDGAAPISNQGVVWSTSTNPVLGSPNETRNDTGSGNSFISNISGLEPITLYYVRAYAVNSQGTAYGNEVTFTTPAILPTLTTGYLTPTSKSTATSGGNVLKDGGSPVTQRGVVWSSDRNFNPDAELVNKTVNGAGMGVFTSEVINLKLSTAYFVRAYARNSVGTAYGNQVTVTLFPTAPILSTSEVTETGGFSANSGGVITSDGGADITQKGLVWSIRSNPTIADSRTSNGPGQDTYTASMTGLIPNTLYYVRAYAQNKIGTAYGVERTFLTNALPTLTVTTAVTNIIATTATSGGDITDDGRSPILERGVTWNTTGMPTLAKDYKTVDKTTTGIGKFEAFLTGLSDQTTYYVRAYAINAVGTTYGSQISFTTLPVMLPTLQTNSPTVIGSSSATSGGNVIDDGGMLVTQRGICWSTSPNPTIALTTRLNHATGGTGDFSIPFSGLTSGTKYYVRAFATNIKGTAYGEELSFVTLAVPPIVGMASLSNVTGTSLDLSATLTSNGGDEITDRGFYYSKVSKIPALPLNPDSLISVGVNGVFAGTLTGLAKGTKYFIWAYASNSVGTGWSAAPTVLNTPTFPVVTTTIPSAITETTATTGGTVTSEGNLSVTARGVIWSTEKDLSIALTTKTLNGTGLNAFTAPLTGLNKGTKYYICAYATNAEGTGYGHTDSLTTLNVPTLKTSPATEITSASASTGGEVLNEGGLKVTARGVVWSNVTNPTIALTTKTSDGLGLGVFVSKLSGLAPGQLYYFRSYATNSIGTGYGPLDSLTTGLVPPTVSKVKIDKTTATTADLSAKLLSSGGAKITEQGLVWSSKSEVPTIADQKIIAGSMLSPDFGGTLEQLTEKPTYYVRAYAISEAGISYSEEVTSFKICLPLTVVHVAGLSGAPVSKTVTYGTVSSDISGAARCWITQNLGADRQPTSISDYSEPSTGWFWQFNRSQGYKIDGATRTPSQAVAPWTAYTPNQNIDWQPENDPCELLLGGGWRIPTGAEWTKADGPPQNWNTITDTYNSPLKLNATGYTAGGSVGNQNVFGYFWSSTTQNNSNAKAMISSNLPASVMDQEKGYAFSLRCLRDTVALQKPKVSKVIVPASGIKTSSAEVSAVLTSDGGNAITSRGFVWSSSNQKPEMTDQKVSGSNLETFTGTLTGLAEGSTVFVRAFASNAIGTGYSAEVTSFKICNPFTVTHTAGLNGAPVTKTVTYGTVSTDISGALRCWTTQNLGADHQAASMTDFTEPSTGWFWQFNRKQGYKQDGAVRTPGNDVAPWNNTSYNEYYNWLPENDPCDLLLGGGWRLPTAAEWTTADGAPQNWNTIADAYNSPLKLMGSGLTNGSTNQYQGESGYFWSSTTSRQNEGGALLVYSATQVFNRDKTMAFSVRCIRDTVVLSKPKLSLVTIPAAGLKDNVAEASATLTSDGALPITARGFVWSNTKNTPEITDQVVMGSDLQTFVGTLTNLPEGPTIYVRAFATNAAGTGYSVSSTTFKVCLPFTVIHKAGFNGAAVDKIVTYQTVSTSISGDPRCWLAQNLGASEQATAFNDKKPEAAGWYWPFNRIQGYEVNVATRMPAPTPSTPWLGMITEDRDWLPANDPCILLLGGGWRLPTSTEWTAANGAPQNWKKDQDAYNSVLKLHNAGMLEMNTGTLGTSRGTLGRFWSNTQYRNSSPSQNSFGNSLQISATASGVISGAATEAYKANGYSLRCIRDGVTVSLPQVSNVSVPLSGMKESSAAGTATVVADGGAELSGSGLVWSTTNKIPDLNDQVLPGGTTKGDFTQTLTGLSDGPTYYVRAYASNAMGTAFSPTVTSFKICNPFTVVHAAGLNGAPVDKTLTYGTVSTNFNGDARCWITQNLGADRQATSVNDASEQAAGWYWQFNRIQGYQHDGTTRTPSNAWTPWTANINEPYGWLAAQDPCMQLLGSGWRLPTVTEMTNVIAAPQTWTTPTDLYNSVLKIHNAGYLTSAAPGNMTTGSVALKYWTSATVAGSNSYGKALYFNGTFAVADQEKAAAMPVRCLRDEIIATLPTVSNVIVPTATMTANSAKAIATVGTSGGNPITARGLVWSSINPIPTISDQKIIDAGTSIGEFNGLINGLTEGPTYYVRAYVETSVGLAYSPAVTSFKICAPLTVIHKAGFNGAAVDQIITYQTVSTNISGASRCWIAQNLGASEQATAFNDTNPEAAGWYWQFNRVQGYEVKTTTRMPAPTVYTPWLGMITEDLDWQPANDPCVLLLAGGWRLPTVTEWTAANAAPQNWKKDQDAYNSVLKLHNAGMLEMNTGSIGVTRGSMGRYWSSTQFRNSSPSQNSFGLSLQISATNSYIAPGGSTESYKANGYTLRCIRDAVSAAIPMVGNVLVPLSGMKESSAEGSATVVADGGAALTGSGLVWSTTNKIPTLTDQVLPAAAMKGDFTQTLTGLSEGPTYYVRAYATNAIGTGYSQTVTSFKICNPVTLTHVAGLNGAPVDKTITYGTVSTNFSGTDARCWITQNLGADRQATSVNDAAEGAAGWYWQFNRIQGYKHDGTTRTPANAWTPWTTAISESWDWLTTQDPCIQLMGAGWRLPTFTEMNSVVSKPQSWTSTAAIYNSVLKLHNAGSLTSTAPGDLSARGTGFQYWTSSTVSNYPGNGKGLSFNGAMGVGDLYKAIAIPVRCLRDDIIATLPIVGNVMVPTATMTANSAKAIATVATSGGKPIIARGLVWSSTTLVPTLSDQKILDSGTGIGEFIGLMNGLTEGPTYYVRAYVETSLGLVYSPAVTSFKICAPLTVIHKAGFNGAAVDQTITYQTVSTNISGAPRCWITQNLGASEQAKAFNDLNPEAAGWYWQFNLVQGYEVKTTTRKPAATIYTPWLPMFNENSAWLPANDPCVQLLGGGWRIPTSTEWTAVDAAPQLWTKDQDAYNSVLKLHNAGILESNGGTLGGTRGIVGRYWSASQYDNRMAISLQLSASGAEVLAGNSADAYKSFGYSVRCIRDAVTTSVPVVSNVLVPVSGMKESSATGSATVVANSGAVLTGRGLVWSTTNKIPTLSDQVLPAASVLPDGSLTGDFTETLTGLSDGPTYYVRAYATNAIGTGYSPVVASFKICNPVTVVHVAGLNGAPVDKTLTYGTVSTNFSGTDARCWITQNLGADRQATSVNDAAEAAAGWYWQFNRIQGYKHDGTTRTPSNSWTPWTTAISESWDWNPGQDPCVQLMGAGWRLPTFTEMNSVVSKPQSWTSTAAIYDSVLKLHHAGSLSSTAPGDLSARGTGFQYWTSSTVSNYPANGKGLSFNGAMGIGDLYKAIAIPVRCLRDEIIATLPTVSNAMVPTANMTASTATAVAAVATSGGRPILARGLVWSNTNAIPTVNDQKIIDSGTGFGEFSVLMNGLVEGPTYHVRAYVETSVGLVYSPAVSSFKICNPVTVVHKAGINGSAVDQTITYQTISTHISGAPRCWLAQNLGAAEPAKAFNDTNPEAAGWYWQFNRVQGYEVKTSTRLPSTPWAPMFNEDLNWQPTSDPCVQMLGGGWRLPTSTEWIAVDGAPQNWKKDEDAFNSVLKIHNAGILESNYGTLGTTRGIIGRYWSSVRYDNRMGISLQLSSNGSEVLAANSSDAFKSFGYSVRCIRDTVTP
ncbi:hypothetical protein [Pedobacter gandavensis]|uniref:hypothetical protein n=1 Tax=Pedobacter gandavensis TaxID=2679963 RepID=UPI00292F835A|nr:hypothetical protein [Pedobacter gandavensis]